MITPICFLCLFVNKYFCMFSSRQSTCSVSFFFLCSCLSVYGLLLVSSSFFATKKTPRKRVIIIDLLYFIDLSNAAHVISIRRANTMRFLEMKPSLLHGLLDFFKRNLKALLVSLVHFLHRDIFSALPVIKQRSQVDPEASWLQNLVDYLDVSTQKQTKTGKTQR